MLIVGSAGEEFLGTGFGESLHDFFNVLLIEGFEGGEGGAWRERALHFSDCAWGEGTFG